MGWRPAVRHAGRGRAGTDAHGGGAAGRPAPVGALTGRQGGSRAAHIQNVHRFVKITNSDSARLVTACTRIRSPSERVRFIHQL